MIREKKISLENLYMIMQQFATLTDAMIPVPQILELITARNTNRSLHTMLNRVRIEVEEGMSLSEAFDRARLKLPDFVIVMIRVGEATGELWQIFREVADYLSQLQKFRRMILQASVYPFLLVCVSGMAIGFMMLFVLPSLVLSFGGSTTQLPAITRLFLGISQGIKEHFVVSGISGLTIIAIVLVVLRTEQGDRMVTRILYRLPLAGKLILKVHMIHLSRNLSLLLNNGIDMIQALSIVRTISSNRLLHAELSRVIDASDSGISISTSILISGLFPHFMKEMIRIGEASSKLPEMLNKVAHQYQMEVEDFMSILSHLLEPVLIIIIGVLIGGILIATYLPLFQLVNQIPG